MSKKGPKATRDGGLVLGPDHKREQSRRGELLLISAATTTTSVSDGEDLGDLEAAAKPSRHLARAFFFFFFARAKNRGWLFGRLIFWGGRGQGLEGAVLRGSSTG